MTVRGGFIVSSAVAVALWAAPGQAKEIPIGDAKTNDDAGLEVAAVYLQPIEMDPSTHQGRALYLARGKSDIHLEADVRARRGNAHGFREGAWVPSLTVRYRLTNLDNGREQSGFLHPMVANDGPHYGANIKMPGVGNYRLTYVIEPPGGSAAEAPVQQAFGRTTKGSWWKPFQVEWTFKYFGPGKKGGY